MASRVTVLVAPNGQTDAEELAEAENGAIIDGEPGDVAVVQTAKAQDFKVAFETVRMLTERLGVAFLMSSAAVRDADRVTAEEIRFRAGELEDALGGVYGVLSQELQLPLVRVLMHHKSLDGRLPAPPAGLVKPVIITGLDALGRGRDFEKLLQLMEFLGRLAALEASSVGQRVDVSELMRRGASALGVELGTLSPAASPAEQGAQIGAMLQALPPEWAREAMALFSRAAPAEAPQAQLAPGLA